MLRFPNERKSAIRSSLPCCLILAVALGVAACGSDEGEEDAAQPITGEYVGPVEGQPDVFVAVAANEGGEITAYACDARKVGEWFTGEATDNSFTLDSTGGDAQLTGEIAEGKVTGTVTLKGEETAYESTRSDGVAGLYTFKTTGGPGKPVSVEGISGLATRLDGQIEDQVLTGTLTTPEGEELDLTSPRAGPPPHPGIWRVILSEDGEARGDQQILPRRTSLSSVSLATVPRPSPSCCDMAIWISPP